MTENNEDFAHVQRIFLTHQTKVIEQNGGKIIQVVGLDEGEEGPPPYRVGEFCTLCWGEDKPFGENTPLRVSINIHGLLDECAVCNGHYIAIQDESNPCIWVFNDGECRGSWNPRVIWTIFHVERCAGGDPCYFRTEGPCSTESGHEGMGMSVSW